VHRLPPPTDETKRQKLAEEVIFMGKVNLWRCAGCKSVLETPLICTGNHGCIKCENCRGTEIELLRDDSGI